MTRPAASSAVSISDPPTVLPLPANETYHVGDFVAVLNTGILANSRWQLSSGLRCKRHGERNLDRFWLSPLADFGLHQFSFSRNEVNP